MKAKILLFIFLSLIFFGSFAQQTDSLASNTWSLKKCVDYALTNNLNVQRSTYTVENTEVDYRQSKMNLLPTLNASASYGYNAGRPLNPVTNQFINTEINSLTPGISSSFTLFNGFRIQNTIKQNSKTYQAAVQDLEKTKNDLKLNIALLYINIIFNKEQLENAKSQLSSSQQQFERTKKQVAAGALPKSSELNLDAQVATNELNVITRENVLNLSLLQLKQALQLPASTRFDVEVPQVDVEDLIVDQSRDQIYDIARQTLPEIKSARLKVESASYNVKSSLGNMYPRLTVSGSVGSRYSSASDQPRFIREGEPIETFPQIGTVDGSGTIVYSSTPVSIPQGYYVEGYGRRDQLKDNTSQNVSIDLTIPIFNNYQSRASYQRSVINRQVASIAEKEAENTLRQSVETAFNDALAASKTYNSSLRQVQAREEAYRMTKQRFDIGATPYVEYQVAENDLFQAKSDLARAKYDLIFKKKVLDFYQGKPLEY